MIVEERLGRISVNPIRAARLPGRARRPRLLLAYREHLAAERAT